MGNRLGNPEDTMSREERMKHKEADYDRYLKTRDLTRAGARAKSAGPPGPPNPRTKSSSPPPPPAWPRGSPPSEQREEKSASPPPPPKRKPPPLPPPLSDMPKLNEREAARLEPREKAS